MLDIKEISFSYSLKRKYILEDFSMKIDAPGIYGLLGPNGAGKSTLLYLIMGMLTPQHGVITMDGLNTRARLPQTMASMMIVPEEIFLPGMSLKAFLDVYAPMYPTFDMDVFTDCMKEFLMEPEQKLNALSMGQKKKVYISLALAARTPLLIMDEPTNGLDIQAKAAFRSLVSRHILEHQTVIISTHQVRDLETLLDHIIIMNCRHIVFSQPVAAIQDRLVFERNVAPERTAGALAHIPSVGGYDIMRPNTDGNCTEINLEILFDVAMRNPALLESLFTSTTNA